MKWETTAVGWAHDMGRIGWLEVVPEEGRWRVLWANFGIEAHIGLQDTVEAAKRDACEWVQLVMAGLSNGLAQGCIVPDDGN